MRADSVGGLKSPHRLVHVTHCGLGGERDRVSSLRAARRDVHSETDDIAGDLEPALVRADSAPREVSFLAGIAPEAEGVPIMRLRRQAATCPMS